MNAVEVARLEGARIHNSALERGDDPSDPYEFARAEADRRGYDVEIVPADAPILAGALAVVSPRDCLIAHQDKGECFANAFLVAHELGHIVLGDAGFENEPSFTGFVDPMRGVETSPSGPERVQDYGAKQRREIQMDLFAREFLVPREKLRDLYLSEELSCSDISSRFAAPFGVIAQQLLDALLLPAQAQEEVQPVSQEPAPELNQEQRDAVNHRGSAFLLEAGPGTGKTRALVGRVTELLCEGVDPKKILVLTFSNKAAGELHARISAINEMAAASLWIGTFHSFGLDLAKRFGNEMEIPADFRLIDRAEAAELLEDEFPSLDLSHYKDIWDPTQIISDILDAISRAKDEVVDHEEYRRLASAMLETAVDEHERVRAERALEVAEVYSLYERIKHDRKCLDFGDLVARPVHLLEQNESVRLLLANTYEHILVDEYQDVNRSSVRLISALKPSGENLWAVGDARQSIYRFRGASSFNTALFADRDFPEASSGRLTKNYRSVDEIVSAFSQFGEGMGVADRAGGLIADREASRISPRVRLVDHPEKEAASVLAGINESLSEGYSFADQAVFCTSHEKLAHIAAYLERAGIPVLFLGNLFERPEIRDLLSILTAIADPRASGLVRVATWEGYEIGLKDIQLILGDLSKRELVLGDWIGIVEKIDGVSESGLQSLTKIVADFRELSLEKNPWTILTSYLLEVSRLPAELAVSNVMSDRNKAIAIWQFLNFVRSQSAGPPHSAITRLLARIRKLVRLRDDRDLRQLPESVNSLDAIRLMTVHAAKGLEFPVVHFAGVNTDTISRPFRTPACPPPDGMIEGGEGRALAVLHEGHDEERECLFYVAISRAMDRLFFYTPDRKRGGAARAVSPFLDRLGPGLKIERFEPLTPPPETGVEAGEIATPSPDLLELSERDLSLYDKCPLRYFYSRVLGSGGRASITPYVSMHALTEEIVRELTVNQEFNLQRIDIEKLVKERFSLNALEHHGYSLDYERITIGLVESFLSLNHENSSSGVQAVFDMDDAKIVAIPLQSLKRADGSVLHRYFRTGRKSSRIDSDIGVMAQALANDTGSGGNNEEVEISFLGSDEIYRLRFSQTKMANARRKIGEIVQKIREGSFPAKPDERVCPRCPHYFVCGAFPQRE